ncbi:serine protease [Ornithinibacillus gellani]|uniref:S1C family serine protease n=1 Tax=Ornithinibacillus gellani TaxID=2293253 RepID=UPI000F45FEE7|nr:S1C family serine protease [Ornithinibacillus gellani]TQS75728.1 serine protease [Ornithinibacillus gellani]
MKTKRYAPIVLSVFVVCIGIAAIFFIHSFWQKKTIAISNPVVNHVNEDVSDTTNLKSILHETGKYVVQIETQNDVETATGSGFIFNEKGDILTNLHVIDGADFIQVRTANAEIYPAAVVGKGKGNDVAVLRVPQLAGMGGLELEKENIPEIGDEVIALGSPHGFQNTVTLGIISGTERNFSVDGYDYNNAYQISAPITYGNSGGPLINRETGHVVGINSVGTEDGTIGFSIPIIDLLEDIDEWVAKAKNADLDFTTIEHINQEDPDQLSKDAEYIIGYFFDSLVIRDYINAYTLIGDALQKAQSYTSFREKYIDIISIDYKNFKNNMTDDNQMESTVDVTIEKKLPNEEKTKKESKKAVFTVGYENDQLKILRFELK